ncbi:nucleoside triphosphate pyrophosphohydrolase [Oceanobacter sp. 4_MG-2023]|uniref:nucleoside triphosphate pyrophosphohydrolase n=2 Tax=Gammaproteobacteria TaxID=1236 RepID=UPI0027325303|nr:nucleoside triphosphate pyrophosphohydrolase [Oceanobacter sp. 4_MG-2023]MDP2547900.1 nucleoside triphosphate pyrophosphohydrolase [Oceanobacter sp. 4_MG-2023]
MYQLEDLVTLMARLRHPQTGCPWDLQQDFASIVPHTLEEAYEVADAIERQDWPHLEEELGDLLFQVIFYGQLGVEKQYFSLASIIDRLVAKLIRRHPHVFPEGTLESEREAGLAPQEVDISRQWEAIKTAEKAAKSQQPDRLLDSVPANLPGLTRAVKLQKKTATVGFDWQDPQAVMDKIREELEEVSVEVEANDRQRLESEIGDLLFAVTNLARHYQIDPEVAIRGTNQRFSQRFAVVEERALASGGWQQATLSDMEASWQIAKQQEKQQAD